MDAKEPRIYTCSCEAYKAEIARYEERFDNYDKTVGEQTVTINALRLKLAKKDSEIAEFREIFGSGVWKMFSGEDQINARDAQIASWIEDRDRWIQHGASRGKRSR